MTQSIADVLDGAAALIEPEGRWIQGSYAKSAADEQLFTAENSLAVCWCALGAIRRAGRYETAKIYDENPAAAVLRLVLEVESIDEWNDAPGRTQAEVVQALREAAAKAREQSS